MNFALLQRAFNESSFLAPLPHDIQNLLVDLDAPPRLAAHLRVVHDLAVRLTGWLQESFATVDFDRESVLFGAGTHDIGKVIYRHELTGPGSEHEQAGSELLVGRGISPHRARFARTHGSWTAPGRTLEDLLVSFADKIWKGKRVAGLEQLIVEKLSDASNRTSWEVFMDLDDLALRIAEDADICLAFQASYPT